MKTLILSLFFLFITYEVIEHVVFPLFGILTRRKKKSFYGPERILGEVGEVKEWENKEGYVFVSGELWKAVSDKPLKAGSKVVVQDIENLTVTVDLWIAKE